MKPIVRRLGLEAPVITLNGGVIIDPLSDEIYYEKNLSEIIYTESLFILKQLHIDFVIFTAFDVFAENPSESTSLLKKYTENKIQWIGDYRTIDNPVKILFIPESKGSVSKIKKCTKHLDIDIIESGFSFTEIVPKGVNKGHALKYVSKMLEVDYETIIAFGENDIEMLRLAGTGVAMGNAPDHIKMTANIITGTNDEDGVYNVLKGYSVL